MSFAGSRFSPEAGMGFEDGSSAQIAAVRRQCRSRVKTGSRRAATACPVYPQWRKSAGAPAMSEKCHEETNGTAAKIGRLGREALPLNPPQD
jgi:hypothetical protein